MLVKPYFKNKHKYFRLVSKHSSKTFTTSQTYHHFSKHFILDFHD